MSKIFGFNDKKTAELLAAMAHKGNGANASGLPVLPIRGACLVNPDASIDPCVFTKTGRTSSDGVAMESQLKFGGGKVVVHSLDVHDSPDHDEEDIYNFPEVNSDGDVDQTEVYNPFPYTIPANRYGKDIEDPNSLMMATRDIFGNLLMFLPYLPDLYVCLYDNLPYDTTTGALADLLPSQYEGLPDPVYMDNQQVTVWPSPFMVLRQTSVPKETAVRVRYNPLLKRFVVLEDSIPDFYGWLKNADFDLFADPDGEGSQEPVIGEVVGTHKSKWESSDEEGIDVFPVGENPDYHWFIPQGCPVRCSANNQQHRPTIVETFIPDLFGTLYEAMAPADKIDHKIETAEDPCDFKGFQSRGKRVDLLHGMKWWNEDSVTAYLPPLWCGEATSGSEGSGSDEGETLPAGTKVHLRWFNQYNAWLVVGYDCCGGSESESGDSGTTGGTPI